MKLSSLLPVFLAWTLSPLLLGVISRVKAFFAGRDGAPVWQPYLDLAKLFRKDFFFGEGTGPVFRWGPVAAVGALWTAALVLPLGGGAAPLSFTGDVVLWAYLLGLARLAVVLAALDTGSSFEGMGASREVKFSALAEPALLLALAAFSSIGARASLSGFFSPSNAAVTPAAVVLLSVALFVVLLSENARVPVDDPSTHLELTMVHEVMVLDHGGPLLALCEYAAALKFWIYGALWVNVALPRASPSAAALVADVAALLALAAAVGVVESVVARLRLSRVPALLAGAGALSVLALLFSLGR